MVVVGEVETVLQFGLCVLGVGVESHASVHHLAVVLARLDVLNSLLEPGEGTERVNDNLS